MNAALMDMRQARNQFENAINAAMMEAARDMAPVGRRKLWLGPPAP